MAVDTAAPLPSPLAMGIVERMVISRSGRGQLQLRQRQVHDRGEGIAGLARINRD